MRPLKDLSEQRFGKLVVKKLSCRKYGTRKIWLCKCDCGNFVEVGSDNLRRHKQESCGCIRNEDLGNLNRKSPYESSLNNLYVRYKNSALRRDYTFNLSLESFKKITSSSCFYCGIEPQQSCVSEAGKRNGSYLHNGIDRIDNLVGYELDNCVPCCKTCNFAKRTMSKDQFLKWIKRVYINQYHKVTNLTPGQLIDLLFTTDYKTWWAQEEIMKYKDSDPEKATKAAVRAQEYNAKRTKLMRTIDDVFDYTEDTNTEKTYSDGNIDEKENYTYFKDTK